MHSLRFVLALSVLPLVATAGARVARGDDAADEARRAAIGEVISFATSVGDATKNGMFGNNNFYQLPAGCTAAIKKGTDAGVKATDTYTDFEGNARLWKTASAMCAEYAKLHALRAVIVEIQPQLQTISAYLGPDNKPDKSITGDAYRDTVAIARTCVANADKAIKAGVVADVGFKPNDNDGDTPITLTEARKICSDYTDFGGKAAVADDKRQAEELAAIKARWTKLGIKGDRLAYLIENGHHTILGKGCTELDDKGKKTSSVFYEVYSDDTAWTVYKTQWKKDKKVKYSQARFRRDGGYSCK